MNQRRTPSVIEDVPPTPGDFRPGSPPPPRRSRTWLWLVVVVLLGAGVYLWRSRSSDTQSTSSAAQGAAKGGRGASGGAIPVVAVQAKRGDIGVYLTGVGTVTSIYTVTVKSRVDGQLMKVNFQEGDLVHQGDLLAEIDPRPFQVQLTQAEGQLTKDQALLDNAQIDLGRYQTLLTHNAVPEQQLATQKALVTQYQGAVKSDQGQIDSAKLNLVYSNITAPITGRVGLRLVDPGNIVHATDATGLLVITQIQPISVIFPIAEDQLPPVLQKVRAGQRLRVDAYDREMKTKLAAGALATLDNQIDPTTATLKLRANFDNHDNKLFPNQFVNARLLVEEKHNVTLVPTAVIQRNNQMTYVYAVKPDSTVTVRQVEVGTTEGDQSEITSGLAPADTVVMTGVDKLQEGSKVNAHLDGAPPAGAQAGAQAK